MSDEPVIPVVTSSVIKHIYFDDDEPDTDAKPTTQKIIERETPATIRVDSSDLIGRCRDFLPLLADVNHKNAFVEDDDPIEIPEILSDKSSKESGEASSTDDEDDTKEIAPKKRKKKKKKKKKKVKKDEENLVNNSHLPLPK